MDKLEQHHVKYKELHEVDEIVMLTRSEHKLIHVRLRRENKYDVSPDELEKISFVVKSRSSKGKLANAERKARHRFLAKTVELE